MFIELESERSSKLWRSAIFSFPKAHCAPPELVTSCDASYKPLAALRPGQIQRFGFQQHTITPLLKKTYWFGLKSGTGVPPVTHAQDARATGQSLLGLEG